MNSRIAFMYWKQALCLESGSRQKKWHVASHAYKVVGDVRRYPGGAVKLAEAIAIAQGNLPVTDRRTPTDIVQDLAKAYRLFVMLCRLDFQKAKQYRRKYPYSRFTTVFEGWTKHEFDINLVWDYLDLEGGNRYVAASIENKENPQTEVERRAERIYHLAVKLMDDYGVPDTLATCARAFVDAWDEWKEAQ